MALLILTRTFSFNVWPCLQWLICIWPYLYNIFSNISSKKQKKNTWKAKADHSQFCFWLLSVRDRDNVREWDEWRVEIIVSMRCENLYLGFQFLIWDVTSLTPSTFSWPVMIWPFGNCVWCIFNRAIFYIGPPSSVDWSI